MYQANCGKPWPTIKARKWASIEFCLLIWTWASTSVIPDHHGRKAQSKTQTAWSANSCLKDRIYPMYHKTGLMKSHICSTPAPEKHSIFKRQGRFTWKSLNITIRIIDGVALAHGIYHLLFNTEIYRRFPPTERSGHFSCKKNGWFLRIITVSILKRDFL